MTCRYDTDRGDYMTPQARRIARSGDCGGGVDPNHTDVISGPQIGADGLRISAAGRTDHGCWPMCRDCKRERYRRAPVPADVRQAVYDRDGHHCLSCGAMSGLTLDHITPVMAGGSDDPDNLQTLCGPCNSRKGNVEVDYR